jgi:hypothetical protein
MFWRLGIRVQGTPAQSNTPLVTEACEGQVTVTDPTHPLYGRTLTLAGLARLPGHVRHCQVEILPGQYGYVPVASTNLQTTPRPEPTVLTLTAVEELVASFQVLGITRKVSHATTPKSRGLGPSAAGRASRRGRGRRSNPHGGGRK